MDSRLPAKRTPQRRSASTPPGDFHMSHLARLLRLGFVSLTLAGIAGGGCGGPTTQPNQSKQPTLLTFGIASADYSRALDRIVIVSPPARLPSTPMAPEIHLLDGHTLDDEVIPLPSLSPYQAPTRISVTPDGTHAVVGIEEVSPAPPSTPMGALVYVDLAARRVLATYPTPSAVLNVAANDTTAFALWQGTGSIVNAVDLATGAISSVTLGALAASAATLMAMSPDGKTLYLDCVAPPSCVGFPSSQTQNTCMVLSSFTMSGGQLMPAATASPGCSNGFGGLYLSRDGSRVYSAAVYSAALSKTTHDPPYHFAVADPSNGQPVALISAEVGPLGVSSFVLDLLDPSTFAKESETALPSLVVDGGSAQPEDLDNPFGSLSVFYDAAGTSRFVLLYWPSASLDTPAYGIASM